MMTRSSGERTRLLLVDDNRLHLLALHEFLSQEGFEPHTAVSGDEALMILDRLSGERARRDPVDVALLDMDLGHDRMDGVELAREILERYDIPIVFHTAHSDRTILDRAQRVSSYGFVHKGLAGEHFLIATVRNAVRLHASERERERLREDFSQFFLHATVGMLTVDADGTILRVNPAFATMVDMVEDELIGRAITAISADAYLEQELNLFNRMVAGEIDSYRIHKAFVDAAGTPRPAHVVVSARRDENGSLRTAFVVAHDVGTPGGVEPELARLQEEYALLAYSANDAVALLNPEGRVLTVTPAIERILGYTPEEIRSLAVDRLLDATTLESLKESGAALSQTTGAGGAPLRLEHQMIRKDGSRIWTESVTTPIRDQEGAVRRLLVTLRDITQRRAAESARREAEERFRLVVEQAVDPIFVLRRDGTIGYASPRSAATTGFAPSALLGRPFADLSVRDQRDEVADAIRRITTTRETISLEVAIRARDGAIRNHSARCGPLVADDGSVEGVLIATRDVTRERELLREKDALLGEVHHRVKNNLQILSSIISLMMHDRGCVDVLTEIQGRVGVVGRLHEMLQNSVDATSIDLATYLRGIVDQVLELAPVPIDVSYETEEVRIDSSRAIKLGLIVQEMVSNAVEHGLMPTSGGALGVGLFARDGRVTFEVRNSAPPVAQHATDHRRHTGMSLIEILVEELEGSWQIDRGAVTTTRVDIPSEGR